MLLTFLYHQVGQGKYSNTLQILTKHLCYISKRYKTVLPGEKLSYFKTEICLTFDDATIDFYTHVFPILKKYKLKALLAVPVAFIEKKNYCTWDMLKEIANCKYIQIASHSYNHFDMTKDIDLYIECFHSKLMLEEKLKKQILTFVYPYGKFNKKVHKEVKQHYKYIMRIGNSLNFGWYNFSNLVYRIPSDNLHSYKDNFLLKNHLKYLLKFFCNSMRLK